MSSIEMGNIVEDFLTNLILTLSEKEFVIDYNNIYPVLEDFQNLSSFQADLYPFMILKIKCSIIKQV